MRLYEFTERVVNSIINEERPVARLNQDEIFRNIYQGITSQSTSYVTMSMADYFDMTGTPYPAGVGDDFYQIRNFEIGYEPGQMSPAMSNLFNEWDRTGRNGVIQPQTIEDWANENNVELTYGTDMFGNPMRYDENPFVVDALWKMAGASWDFIGDVTAGTAGGMDTAGRYLGISRFTDPTKTDASDVVRGFVDFSRRVANSNYALMDQKSKDRLADAESGITSLDEVWALAMGDTQGINIEGLALMVAGELPSEMAAVVTFGIGRFGLALAGGLNATEAMGSTGESMDSRVEEMWDNGVLEGSRALALAQELFPEDNSAQLQFIQDQVRNQTLLAVGATAGLADTIGDRLSWTGLSSGRVSQVGRRLILGAMADSGEEGAQQFLENLGVQEGTGVRQDLTQGVVNAMYQGAVVGTGTVAVGNTALTAAETAERIQNYFRNNPTATDELLEMSNSERHATIERLRQQFGNIDAVTMFDGIPSPDELSREQQRQLARTGFTQYNGRRVTNAQIKAAADPDNRRLLAILQYADLDADTDTAVLRFESAETLQRIANTLGIDTSRIDLTNQSQVDTLRDRVEQSVQMDVNLLQRTEIKTPLWNDLDDTQKMQLLNRGWAEANGARFDLETVARHSIEQGDDGLPDARYFNDLRDEVLDTLDAKDIANTRAANRSAAAALARRAAGAGSAEPQVVSPNDLAENIPDEIETPEDIAATRPSVQDRIAAPAAPSRDVARAHIVYNTMMRLANGNMEPDVARAMLDRLESNYPGISDEILRGRSVDDFANNPEEITSEIQRDPPERPSSPTLDQTIVPPNGFDTSGGMRPPAGIEIERNGTTYRFLGRMWARVDSDGNIGSPGQVPTNVQRSLSSEWRQQTTTSPARPEPPSADVDSTNIIPTTDPTVSVSRPPELTPPQPDTAPARTDTTPSARPEVDDAPPQQPRQPEIDTDADVNAPAVDPRINVRPPPRISRPDDDTAPARTDTTPSARPDVQTDIDQPTEPEVDTDSDTVEPAVDPRINVRTPPRISRPDDDTAPERTAKTKEPEVDDTVPQRPRGPEVDTDADVSVGDPDIISTPRTAPSQLAIPDVDTVISPPQSIQSRPDSITTRDQEPDAVSDRSTDTAPDAVVDPNIAVAPVAAMTTNRDTDTTRTRRPNRFGIGGGLPIDAEQMRFDPINIRDPLNLKRFG